MGLFSSLENRIKRRRALRRYLEQLSEDLARRDSQLDRLEERVASESEGFHDRLVREVLARAEILLGELDRRIDQLDAQTRGELAGVERRLAEDGGPRKGWGTLVRKRRPPGRHPREERGRGSAGLRRRVAGRWRGQERSPGWPGSAPCRP